MNKQELYHNLKILIDKAFSEHEKVSQNNCADENSNFITLAKRYHSIKIPIIQRDYAQGREDEASKYIRQEFLDNIKSSLDKGLNLDFIYGSVNSKGEFELLDGQQRLTTLFLLYVYACKKEGREDLNNNLSQFSYETRISSKDFFKTLINQKLELKKDDKITDLIKNSCWFHCQWGNDPTVKGSLNMLADIHKKFFEIKDLSKKLENITFYILDIEAFNLSDELYIKMNSRGKALTDFENLKAQILKENNEVKKELSEDFDTKWSEFLWEKVKNLENPNKEKVDDFHIKMILSAIIKTLMEIEIKDTSVHFDAAKELSAILDEIKNAYSKQINGHFYLNRFIFDIFKNKNFSEIFNKVLKKSEQNSKEIDEKYKEFTNEILKNLKKIFNLLINYGDKASEILEKYKIHYEAQNGYIKDVANLILKDDVSYSDYIMFFAQIFYLDALNKCDINENDFIDWIRFIRNLTNVIYFSNGNAKIKSENYIRNQRFKGPFKIISGILNCSNQSCPFEKYIYDCNSDIEKLQKFINHEKEKYEFIKLNNNAQKYIFALENNILFKGNLEFLFTQFNLSKKEIDISKLSKLSKLAKALHKSFKDDVTDDFRRAFLTIGEKPYDFIRNRHNCYVIPNQYKYEVGEVIKYRLFANYTDIQWCLTDEIKDEDKEDYQRIKKNFSDFFIKISKYAEKENPLKSIIDEYLQENDNINNSWIYHYVKQTNLPNYTPHCYIVVHKDRAFYLRIERPQKPEDFWGIGT